MMMHTRSKTRAQLKPNQTSPDTQQQYQVDKVISDTVSSPSSQFSQTLVLQVVVERGNPI